MPLVSGRASNSTTVSSHVCVPKQKLKPKPKLKTETEPEPKPEPEPTLNVGPDKKKQT